jgi:acetyl-CoA synthetase
MTTVGEPIEPEVWKWYHKEVGKGEAIIVDTWWQTETGGFLCSTLPAITPMKPGSAGPGMPGIHPIISTMKARRCRAARARPATSASRIPGRVCSRPSGETGIVSWTTYFARYCKDPKAKTGAIGPI